MRISDMTVISYEESYDPDCPYPETLYLDSDGTYFLQIGGMQPEPLHLTVPQHALGYQGSPW